MARKKEPTIPLFGLKHDFYASLDNMTQEALNLMNALETALDLGKVHPTAAEILRERLKAFRATLTED